MKMLVSRWSFIALVCIGLLCAPFVPGESLGGDEAPDAEAVEAEKKIVPKAALLPFRTNDKKLAEYGYGKLTGKLTEEKLFEFVPQDDVRETMRELDIPTRINMNNEQLSGLGAKLGVDYVLWGNFTVSKDLTFIGFRRDIGIKVRIFSVEKGKDHSGSAAYQTGMLFVKPGKVTDGEYMTDLAVGKVIRSFRKRMGPKEKKDPSRKGRSGRGRRR